MRSKIQFLMVLTTMAFWAGFPTPCLAEASSAQTDTNQGGVHPENTLILANAQDARFSRDFSVLLDHTRLEWIVLESPTVPESAREQNLILLGSPDSPITGEVIRELATPEEIELLQTQQAILEIASPWNEDRTVIICSGANSIGIRDAAERALRSLIDGAPPTADWIRTPYEAPRDLSLQATLEQLQYSWEDEELPIQDLTMDVDAKVMKRISTQEASEDVERLFYLLSHGYSGYAYHNQEGEFDRAKTDILEELSGQSSWSSSAFSDLLYDHLNFISDCHLSIGEKNFNEHSDFWYDTKHELTLGINGYQLISKGIPYTVVSINGGDPDPYAYPSLNQEGDPIYRLGTLSPDQPPPLQIVGLHEGEEHPLEVKLERSDFDYYAEEVFREDTLGGIPVIRVRSFGDYFQETLDEFTKTATSHRGDPVVVVDIRGNGGGNESWPINWIQRLTGRRPDAIFVFSELESKTSLMGRANAFDYWIQTAAIDSYQSDLRQYTDAAIAIESGSRQAHWTGPFYPDLPLIINDTTVVVVTNDLVASAGEGFVLRSSQLENVVVVGENTMGCLTFGNISAHMLPHSNLMVWMPINFGLFPDQEVREGVGLAPDLWVPAPDAVNYAVAALRKGTISTALPLAKETLEADFKPESSWSKFLGSAFEFWPVIALFAAFGAVWGYFNRRNPRLLLLVGVAWCLFGVYWIITGSANAFHYGMLAVGILSLAWGIFSFLSSRREHLEKESPSS